MLVDGLQGESARRAITGAEFFNRYPSLHNFLLTQLQAASQQLQQGATLVHPSLFPVLALLSRLRWVHALCCVLSCCTWLGCVMCSVFGWHCLCLNIIPSNVHDHYCLADVANTLEVLFGPPET